MDDGDEMDRLLRLADPGPGPDATALIGDLGQAVMAAQPALRRPRRRRWGVASIVGVTAALLTATTAVAYTAVVSTHTGQYGEPGNTENDTSEWLRTDGSDFRAVVEGLRPTDVPVPPGFTFAGDVDAYMVRMGKEPAVVQVTGVRSSYAYWAICAWEREWLTANAAGDPTRQGAATEILRQVPSWPLVVATDGGGTVDLQRSVADAAGRGDAGPVRRDVDLNCRPLAPEESR